ETNDVNEHSKIMEKSPLQKKSIDYLDEILTSKNDTYQLRNLLNQEYEYQQNDYCVLEISDDAFCTTGSEHHNHTSHKNHSLHHKDKPTSSVNQNNYTTETYKITNNHKSKDLSDYKTTKNNLLIDFMNNEHSELLKILYVLIIISLCLFILLAIYYIIKKIYVYIKKRRASIADISIYEGLSIVESTF
ncbi:hypothetical protein H311_02080, partial [Anncaliia algerae PRA109]